MVLLIEEATKEDPRIKELLGKLNEEVTFKLYGIQLHEGVVTMIWTTKKVDIPKELLGKQLGGLCLDWDVCPVHHKFLMKEEKR